MIVTYGPDYFEGVTQASDVRRQDVDIVASTYQGTNEVILNIGDAGAFLTPQQAHRLGRYLLKASKQSKKELR